MEALTTEQWIAIIVGVVVLLAIIIGVILYTRQRRQRGTEQRYADRYGAEYRRTVEATGSPTAAISDIEERERLHDQYPLSELPEAEQRRFAAEVATLQYRFVEDPSGAIYELGRVAADVLRRMGYPMAENRELALRLFGVDHPSRAPVVRTVIEGKYPSDVADLRQRFLDIRDALREAAGIHYAAEDAHTIEPPREEREEPPRSEPATAPPPVTTTESEQA